MHSALCCTCSMRNKFSTFSFPSFSFASPWLGLQLDHWCCWWQFPISLSMMLVLVYFLPSCSIHKELLLMPPCHFSTPSLFVFTLFIFLWFTALSLYNPVPPSQKKIWLLDHILPASFTSHLVLMVGDVSCGWLLNHFFSSHCLFSLSLSWFIGV